ncbi:MAG TPA: translation initiation factor IF-2 [bacterium]|nr:translation initiation factor IF-2 [bacterium]
MRVHELAKELGIPSKDLIEKLKSLGHDVKGHMSSLDEKIIALARQSAAAHPPAAPAAEAKKEGPAAHPHAPAKPKAVKKEKAAEPAASKAAEPAHEAPKKHHKEPHAKEHAAAHPKEIPAAAAQPPVAEPPAAEPAAPAAPPQLTVVDVAFPISVKDLAEKLHCKSNELIMKLMSKGVFASINQALDLKTANAVAVGYGVELTQKEAEKVLEDKIHEELFVPIEKDDAKDLVPRWPIVTFMGHVDHGKTSLLDYIRKTKVTAGESGGITQHIGAYEVVTPRGHITFLDTPGHKAFTAMRARGANVTDITVLVVAADDGVMPQTIEAIDHSQAANVPLIVAVNKIDLPTAAPDKIKRKLAEKGLSAEDWGGQTIFCEVSAKTGQGVDNLLEMILLQAEIMELKANPNRRAHGIVIEAKTSKGRGIVTTVLVKNGTLTIGDPIFCDKYSGRVRALFNDRGQHVRKAGPAVPVEVMGLDGVPEAGAEFLVTKTEREAKELSEMRQHKSREESWGAYKHTTLEDLYREIVEGKTKDLRLIVKGDVQGSLEALNKSLEELSTKEVAVKVISSGTGDVSETDVMLAAASNAVIVGFHVKADGKIKEVAGKEGVEIRTYSIIYDVVEDVKKAMEGMLEPKTEEVVMGHAIVKQVFNITKVGKIAGCFVKDGRILRSAKVRILRDGKPVHEGELVSLKRFKDEVKEVKCDFECGIRVGQFDGWQENDIVEAYMLEVTARKLS